jgi:hypothetical protein
VTRAARAGPAGLALLLAALAACLDPIPAGILTPGTGSVSGVVRRRCGGQPPIAGAEITVDGVVRARTDAAGGYRIDDLSAATAHTVTAEAPGFVYGDTETIIHVNAGEVVVQNFALEMPKDEGQAVLLDVLFVIDDGPGMAAAQEALIAAFPAFAATLEQGSINLHLGIATADVGAGDAVIPTCTPGGDDGRLQIRENGATCARAGLESYTDPFLSLIRDAGGVAQSANFAGTLSDAFACYAPVGTSGCRFAKPLASMRRVLDPTRSDNGAFLREDAALLVILLTKADDCSTPAGTDLFDPFQTTVDSPLGPLTRYRCFEFGTLCDGKPPGRTAGARTGCAPGVPDPAYPLASLQTFLDLLAATHGGRAVLGVIAGDPARVEVALDGNGYPYLLSSCGGTVGGADPPIRLAALAGAMPQTNRANICRDFSADLAMWAQQAIDMAVAARSCE